MIQFLLEVSCAGISKKYPNTYLGYPFSLRISYNYTIECVAVREFITFVGPQAADMGHVSLCL